MKILIAYDGSSCADEAVNDLSRAGLPRSAEALIVCVNEGRLPNNSGESVEKLNSAAANIASHFPEWTTEILHLQGSPAREILTQAKNFNADLIVIGSHSQSENKRFTLGSVSQKVANEAECSVRIVRGETWKNGSPSRLLIALDGTTSAMFAAAEAARRMWSPGSEVRLVSVQNNSNENSQELCEYVETATKILQRAELSVTESVETGNPKQLIVSAAEEWGADCVFLGANDADNYFENQLLGGISTAIIAKSHCTVEVVRNK